MNAISSKDLLVQLKQEYQQRNVSALVGAGFSKNALPEFPSWSELLAPIVEQLYPDEFERQAHQENSKAEGSSLSGELRQNKICEALLQKYGNLEVVSEYIRRKGMGHEAIDAYIEQYIHPASPCENGWRYGDRTYPSEALNTHTALLRCDRFRNIYTTNYDNLLELAQDVSDISDKLRVITSETTLSDTSSARAIIKLHGDISQSTEQLYEFDGDKNLKYIISKEDYDTYLQRHQGFSYLMRLAMLQGRFCLIGFSGSDPNYMLWLQWMKDVLDKAHEQDRQNRISTNGTPEMRVYLVSAFTYHPTKASELFYRNHHVGVIDLTDAEVREELLSVSAVTDRREAAALKPSEWLQLLFRYLHENDEEEDIIHQTDRSSKEAETYLNLWRTVDEALSRKANIAPLLQQIEKKYNPALNPLYAGWQDTIITRLLHKELSSWNPDYSRLMSLAVRDMGTLPAYYAKAIPEHIRLQEDEIWQQLIVRERILSGASEPTDADLPMFDKIMTAAYALDFESMYQLLEEWQPDTANQPRRWLLLSLFRDRETDLPLWDKYIRTLPQGGERWNVCSMRNIQARDWPPKYDLTRQIRRGFTTVTKKIQDSAKHIVRPKKDTEPYGRVTLHSVSFTKGKPEYERSIRVLNLLYDNAFVPNYYASSIIDDRDWYDVFMQLYEYRPCPTIYYSLFIKNSKLLCRMGQDTAYSNELYRGLAEWVRRMIIAVDGVHTPRVILSGLLTFTRECYATLQPDAWSELFVAHIFEPWVERLTENVYAIDDEVQNICTALSYITRSETVNHLFVQLMLHFDANPKIVTQLCVDYMRLEYLQEDNGQVAAVIQELVSKGTMQGFSPIYYILAWHKKLSQAQQELLGEKLLSEDLSFVKDDKISIIHLSYLAHTPAQKARIVQLVTGTENIWDSGVTPKSRTSPAYLNLTAFPNDWEWQAEAMEHIANDMKRNVSAWLGVRNLDTDWFECDYLDWIKHMVYFCRQNRLWHTQEGEEITELLEHAMARMSVGGQTDILLMSNDYHVLRFGFERLLWAIEDTSTGKDIQKYDTSINILLTRAMMKDSEQFETIVGQLRYLVAEYPEQMVQRYSSQLLYVLRESRNLDYAALNLNLAQTTVCLQKIAKVMSEHGGHDDVLHTWETEPLLTRFQCRYDR